MGAARQEYYLIREPILLGLFARVAVSDELKERRAGRLVVEPVQVARASSPAADVDTARRADALEFIAIQLAQINTKLETFLFKLRS